MTVTYRLRVHRSEENLAGEGWPAWSLAEVAADMIVSRVIDNAAVAAASLTRAPVSVARQQALDHAVSISGAGATVFGCSSNAEPAPNGPRGLTGWPCANSPTTTPSSRPSTRTRVTTSHRPSPSPSASAATGVHSPALAVGYEIQIDLVRAISLHEHKIDHVAHFGPSAAGMGTLLGLPIETTY